MYASTTQALARRPRATGFHFAKPGNRFWPALHKSGITPRLLHPSEERELLTIGVGVTKLVHRATATAAELTDAELKRPVPRILIDHRGDVVER